MATVSFLWHLHQPGYRTADRRSWTPWVVLHSGGAYRTLAEAIADTNAQGQVVNIVPSLFEQLLAYRDGSVDDPVMAALVKPAVNLDNNERDILLEWCFSVTPRQLARFPRLRELEVRRSARNAGMHTHSLFGPGDLRDLQVLFILAQSGEQAWRDQRLASLFDKGSRYSGEDHRVAANWLRDQPGELLDLWNQIRDTSGVEIATSPFAHPIIPLLLDTAIVRDSWAPAPPPTVPEFSYPQDARWQLREGLELMQGEGFEITGCWPPEGSVSLAALEVYSEAGIRWLVTDEGILERSLGQSIRHGDSARDELYRPWRPVSPSPTLFFRDRHLSDRIGFVYGNWHNEAEAAADLVDRLVQVAERTPEDAAIVIALDGENPWLHFPQGGGVFLRELFDRLQHAPSCLRPACLNEVTAASLPRLLPDLHPGSWINSVFATWIGHPEKTQAWRILAKVRSLLEGTTTPQPPSLLLAEASDWFWWLGDDNPNPQAPLFDQIFRQHLIDACEQAGIEAPSELYQPIKTDLQTMRVPTSAQWPEPKIDGRLGSYFEWSMATTIENDEHEGLQRISLRAGPDNLFILVEGSGPLCELIADCDLLVSLQSPTGEEHRIIATSKKLTGANWAVERIGEFSLPWNPAPGYRLQIVLGNQQIPAGASVLLEPFWVD